MRGCEFSACFFSLLLVTNLRPSAKRNIKVLMHATFLRKISNRAYLRKMNVPVAMDKLIRARYTCKGSGVGGEKMDVFISRGTAHQPLLSTRYKRNHVVQRWALHVKDDEHRSWPVTYEVRVSSGQKHRRLTNGWAAFCRGNGFGTGDKLTLAITCADEQGGCVEILVQRLRDRSAEV